MSGLNFDRLLRPLMVLSTFAAMSACSVAPEGAAMNDPYEATNRQVHEFNKQLDRAVLRPVSQSTAKLPQELTDPVVNFAENTGLPSAILNGALQGDIGGVATNAMRFVINTTVGIGGLFDPADAIGLYEEKTDFGETLAVWGVGEGAYMELPGFGPSTERDTVGLIVDFIIDPIEFVGTPPQIDAGVAPKLASKVIDRGRFGGTVDSILYESADSYAQARLLYLQNRRFELGQTSTDTYIDPYADPYFDPYQDQ